MNIDRLYSIINGGESETVEFKMCLNELSASVYESICALLNRHGGHLFIGVSDNSEIIGLKKNMPHFILINSKLL